MKIAKVFGITIRVNVFFIVLFLVLFFMGKHTEGLIAFGVVILHEMAHIITAVNYGFTTNEVELLPFGGVAKIEQGLEGDPYAEIFVALAGPLANFCMVGMVFLLQGFEIGNQQWVPFFVECNLTLGTFNLLPAYPLDGGRIYRAFLATKIGVKKAADRALSLTWKISVAMAAFGLGLVLTGFQGINFLIIGGFLFFESIREKGNTMFVFLKYLNRKQGDLSLHRMMLARHVVVCEDVMLKEVVRYFVPQKYHIVIRVDVNHSITGIFTEKEIISRIMGGDFDCVMKEM